MARKPTSPDAPVTIKKYPNRRLYNTDSSSYITLDALVAMIRQGREFVVLDSKSGDDITHSVLTQIVLESEGKGSQLLPAGFLRQLISMYGEIPAVLPGYLEASLSAFRTNQDKMRNIMEGALASNPLAELTKRNIALFEAAAGALMPKSSNKANEADELARLRTENAVLKAELAKRKA